MEVGQVKHSGEWFPADIFSVNGTTHARIRENLLHPHFKGGVLRAISEENIRRTRMIRCFARVRKQMQNKGDWWKNRPSVRLKNLVENKELEGMVGILVGRKEKYSYWGYNRRRKELDDYEFEVQCNGHRLRLDYRRFELEEFVNAAVEFVPEENIIRARVNFDYLHYESEHKRKETPIILDPRDVMVNEILLMHGICGPTEKTE